MCSRSRENRPNVRPIYAISQRFPRLRVNWGTCDVGLTDDDLSWPFNWYRLTLPTSVSCRQGDGMHKMYVLAGSTSTPTLHSCLPRHKSHLTNCLCFLPAFLSTQSFPLTPASSGQYNPHGDIASGCRELTHTNLGAPIYVSFLFCSKSLGYVGMMTCV